MKTGPERTIYGAITNGVWIDDIRQFNIRVYRDDEWLLTMPGQSALTESMYDALDRVGADGRNLADLPRNAGMLSAMRWGHPSQIWQHVNAALDMVTALPELYHDDNLPVMAQHACLEAFLVNARLLTDFLTREGDGRDFSAWDLATNWTPDPGPSERLRSGAWIIASRQVVHFSRERLQDPTLPLEHIDTSLEALSAIRDDIRALYGSWQAARQAVNQALPPQP